MESSTVAFSCHRERRRGANWGLRRIFLPSWRTMVSITPVHGGVTFSCTPGNPPRCRFRAIRGAVVERIEDRGGVGVSLWNEPKACNPCGRLTFVSAISLAKISVRYEFGKIGRADDKNFRFGSLQPIRHFKHLAWKTIWSQSHDFAPTLRCSPTIVPFRKLLSSWLTNRSKSHRTRKNRRPWRSRGVVVERIDDRGRSGLR